MSVPSDRFDHLMREVWAKVTPEQRKYLEASGEQSEMVVVHRRRWLACLADAIAALDSLGVDAGWPYIEAFWIKIHSVLLDLPAQFAKAKRASDEDPAFRPTPVMAMVRVFDAIAALEGAFTEDELIAIDFLRQHVAHVRPETLEIRWIAKKSAIADQRGVRLTEQTYPVPEVRKRVRALTEAHGSAEVLAVTLARRARPLVDAIIAAERALDSVNL